MVINMAQIAKLPRSIVLLSLYLVTNNRKAPIKITLAKYENIAIAIVAKGSKFLETRATSKCTLKKIITVSDAKTPPYKPDLPFTKLIITELRSATIEAGAKAPRQSWVSLI